MPENCELGRGLRRREKNATKGGAGRFEKPAPDARAAPPEAHELLIGRKTVEEIQLTGLSFNASDHDRGVNVLPQVSVSKEDLTLPTIVLRSGAQSRQQQDKASEKKAETARIDETYSPAHTSRDGGTPSA